MAHRGENVLKSMDQAGNNSMHQSDYTADNARHQGKHRVQDSSDVLIHAEGLQQGLNGGEDLLDQLGDDVSDVVQVVGLDIGLLGLEDLGEDVGELGVEGVELLLGFGLGFVLGLDVGLDLGDGDLCEELIIRRQC